MGTISIGGTLFNISALNTIPAPSRTYLKQSSRKYPPMNAIESYAKYGVTRTQVASLSINIFHYPQEYRDTLSKYFLLYWEGKYFRNVVFNGTIEKDSTNYLVIYHGCTPVSAMKASELRLSFREPNPDFNLMPYVLVQISKESL